MPFPSLGDLPDPGIEPRSPTLQADSLPAEPQVRKRKTNTIDSRKMVVKNLFAGQQWRNRHREQTCGHRERGGEGEMYGRSNMETYISICKIDSQWEFSVWLRKLKQGLSINLEVWDGAVDRGEVDKREV